MSYFSILQSNWVRQFFDYTFIFTLVFALFLGDRIVPLLIMTGILPLILFWSNSDYSGLQPRLRWLLIPFLIYIAYGVLALFFFTGLEPGAERPINPSFELYATAVVMLMIGLLRSLQISNLAHKTTQVLPIALLISFGVLTAYLAFDPASGCRVTAEAAWPFIPALLFGTLSLLALLQWHTLSTVQRYLRLLVLSLSVLVAVSYTGSRGVAVAMLVSLIVLFGFSLLPRFKRRLPSFMQLSLVCILSVGLIGVHSSVTGCTGIDRLLAISQTAINLIKQNFVPSNEPQTHWIGNAPLLALASTEHSATDWAQPSVLGNMAHNFSLRSAYIESDTEAGLMTVNQGVVDSAADSSIRIRLEMWLISLELVKESPLLGHGALSMKALIQDEFGPAHEHNHNQFLSWAVSGGLILLLLGLAFLLIPAWISAGLTFNDKIILILAVSVFWGISQVFDSFFNQKFFLHYFAILLGFLFALSRDLAKDQPNEESRSG